MIPTLNRHEHLQRCIESLSACTHADKTELFIFLDHPLKDSHKPGYELIKAYLPGIKGFKKVNVIERPENYGVRENFSQSVEYVLARYDRMIFTEDDNEFSPNFLDYMNKGLDKFENEENVFAVSGYCQPIKIPETFNGNYIRQRRLCAWGFGTWKKKWISLTYSTDELAHCLKDWKTVWKLYKRSQGHLVAVLLAVKEKKNFFGDMAVGMYFVQNENLYCINPTFSKVRNLGHDGSGTNCGQDREDIYKLQKIDNESTFDFSDYDEDDALIQAELAKLHGLTLRGKMKLLLRYLFFLFKYKFKRSG